MNKVYKVVYKRGLTGDLVSCAAIGQAEVAYPIGEITGAPDWLAALGYHITVFKTIAAAIDFVDVSEFSDDFQLWEVEAFDLVELPPRLSLWKLEHKVLDPIDDEDWPEGTQMYKRVKLVKRVDG